MIVMTFRESDETTWKGEMQDSQWTQNICAFYVYSI